MPQEQADQFFPSPTILCPISGDPIRVWHLIDGSGNGVEWFEKDDKSSSNQDQNHDFKKDFRIEGFSPSIHDGKLRVRVHCFVKDGDWVHSEICEVKNVETGKVIYTTDEETPEELLQKLKQKQASSE